MYKMKRVLECEKAIIRKASLREIQDKKNKFREQRNKVEGEDSTPTRSIVEDLNVFDIETDS